MLAMSGVIARRSQVLRSTAGGLVAGCGAGTHIGASACSGGLDGAGAEAGMPGASRIGNSSGASRT